MMKYNYIMILFALFAFSSCEKFSELNTNPVKSSSVDPNMQLSYVQLATWGKVDPVTSYQSYASGFVQHFQGEYNVTNIGGKYRIVETDINLIWSEPYNKSIKECIDIIERTKDDPAYASLNAMVRIYKVYLFSVMTDFFGDIPYFEAGRGFWDANFTPAYDLQEAIYKDFFKELDETVAVLSADNGSAAVTGDLIYRGNVANWVKLANSLHLRLALRVVKVDPQLSRAEASKALNPVNGGLIASPAEEALIPYIADVFDWDGLEIRRNAQAQVFIGRESRPLCYLSSTLWNALVSKNDPRLFVIGRIYWGEGNYSGLAAQNRPDLTEEALAARGMSIFQPVDPGFFAWDRWPNGYWSNSLQVWVDQYARPQLNNFFLKSNIPGIIMTFSEVQFLLSEVATRWGDVGTTLQAEDYYREGVTAAMNLYASKYNGTAIPPADIAAYLGSNPFPASETGRLQDINEQLWLLHLTNPPEAYANWRRSGYPVLRPAPSYGALTIHSQTIPRRLSYPIFEKSYNPSGYQAAIDRMGGVDDWNKRIWWDKE